MSVAIGSMSVRLAKKSELPIVHDLAWKIFPVTYKEILSPSQTEYMMDWMYSVENLEKDVDRGVQYYIFTHDGEDIGYTAFEMTEPDTKGYKLHKIYLLPAHQGKGLGKIQLAETLQKAKEDGAHSICLNVNRNNKAVAFYKSQGWEVSHDEDNHIGNGFYMNDHVMKKTL